MRYNTILFDLDDTLLDFQANEAQAMKRLFDLHHMPLTEEFLEVYHNVNEKLWKSHERGEIPLSSVLGARFSDSMRELGVEIDGRDWDETYRGFLADGHELIPGAYEICDYLKDKCRLVLITNGAGNTQRRRLEASGLIKFFPWIFISQDLGAQKPSKEFFDAVKKGIPDFTASSSLVIGDSLTSDIKGANDAGIDCCWFNPTGKTSTGINFTYTISKLSELKDIIEQ